MCGIVGAVLRGGGAAAEVYGGLERLEYRGYDSAGMSVFDGKTVRTVKRSGRVGNIREAAALSGAVALGHTRWATHGRATDVNAHPHVCGHFSVVHNGIIENYGELRAVLEKGGAHFLSDTDSEAAAQLLNAHYKGDPLAAVSEAVKRLKGTFALGILCDECDFLIAVKRSSPVVLGLSERGNLLSSDVPALPKWVKYAIFPEDGDIAVIRADKIEIFDGDLKPVKRVKTHICAGQLPTDKGNYPHYMLKEIHETARTLKDTAAAFDRSVDGGAMTELVTNASRVILTGCGTAYNAALAALPAFRKINANCTAAIASEINCDPPPDMRGALAVAVTQSGETADTVEAVRALTERGALAVAVTNCGYSAVTRICNLTVPVCAGPEICVAATKSYSGQFVALNLMVADDRSEIFGSLPAACTAVDAVVSCANQIEKLASECANSRAVFFLGRGVDWAVAEEGALKLKEVSYTFADAYPAGELKHGTLALVDGGTLSIFICTGGRSASKCRTAVNEVLSRGGRAAVISDDSALCSRLQKEVICWQLPPSSALFSPLVAAVALQCVAYRAALILGRDPDRPRNLAKSVTVE